MWSILTTAISIAPDCLSAIAAAVALYLFFFRRKQIVPILKLLLRFSFQTTVSELYSKLDRLNGLSADDTAGKAEVINILSEVEGQIAGNGILRRQCSTLQKKISQVIRSDTRLNEPAKRSLISEIRETLRHVDLTDYHLLAGRNE